MTSYLESARLHGIAEQVFPRGVNSGVRIEQPYPLTFRRGFGSRLIDVDGNEYIDYTMGQGALLLGHADPQWVQALTRQAASGTHFAAQSELEVRVGVRLRDEIASIEMLRFASSATEAVQAVLRIARAATGRSCILRFEGHYHGWSDEGLAGFAPAEADYLDGHRSRPRHASAGVLAEPVSQFVVGRWNDAEGLREILSEHRHDLAAVIFEPIMCNTGCIAPEPDFLEVLRTGPQRAGAVLICDETITGFRNGIGGAQALFGITPDITVLGKALGGGVPIAAFGGRRGLFEGIDQPGQVRHGGTLNANPLCLAAVDHMLDRVTAEHTQLIAERAAQLESGLRELATEYGMRLLVQRNGGVVHTAISSAARLRDYRDVVAHTDAVAWAALRRRLLDAGVRVIDRGLWYLSYAHTESDIQATLQAAARAVKAFIAEDQAE
jgi:glutamate-1-semialdehyde 2,1-aminomutase